MGSACYLDGEKPLGLLRVALKDSGNHFHSDGALENTEFECGKESFKHLRNDSS